jgi:hypothetical protein
MISSQYFSQSNWNENSRHAIQFVMKLSKQVGFYVTEKAPCQLKKGG